MSDATLRQMVVLAQSWLTTDIARDSHGDPDVTDLAACIRRAEKVGLSVSNNTWRAAFVSAHARLVLITWLVARGIAPTRQAIIARLGDAGDDAAQDLVGFGVLALAADRNTLAVTVIGERCEAAFRILDQGAAGLITHDPLADTQPVAWLALPVSLN